MRLMEYESKEVLKRYGIALPNGQLVSSTENTQIDGPVMLKAQIPSGGRGKAGGIIEVSSEEEAKADIKRLLSTWMRGY